MYTCDRCQKEYVSERRYESHRERCTLRDLDDDIRSLRSSRSTSSRRSNAISDIENDYRRDSRMDVDKLLREKTKLKADLKKYTRELQRVKEANRDDMEKSQDYFNQQILELTEERDQLTDDLTTARDVLLNEKERLRDEFNRKLSAHKEQLEKRYSSNSNKQTKRLNDMVSKLQDKLDGQIEEKDEIKQTLEEYYTQREEELRKEVEKHQEENQKIRATFEAERAELKRIAQTCSIEKDAFKMKCDTERNQEIQKVILDKKTAVQTLEGLNQTLQRRIDVLEADKAKETDTLKTSHQNTIRMKEHQMNEMKANFKRKLEESTKSLESQLELANQQIEKAVLETVRKHEEKLKQETSQHEKIVEALRVAHDKELRDMNLQLQTARSDVEYQKKHTEDSIKHKEQDMLRQFQQITEKLEGEKESLRQESEKNYTVAITERERKLSQLKDEFDKMEEELVKHRIYTKRVKQDAEDIKNKCVASLNKQKIDTDKVIAEREKHIQTLEEQLTKTKGDCTKRLENGKTQLDSVRSSLELEQKKTTTLTTQYNDLQRRYDEAERGRVNVATHYENRIETMKREFETKISNIKQETQRELQPENTKLKMEIDQLNASMRKLKDEYITKINNQKDNIRKKYIDEITNLQSQLTARDNEISFLQQDFIDKMNAQRENMKAEFEQAKKALPNYEKNILDRDTQIARLNTEIAQVKGDFVMKIKEVMNQRNELEEKIKKLESAPPVPNDFDAKYSKLTAELSSAQAQFIVRMNEQRDKYEEQVQNLKKSLASHEQENVHLKNRLKTEQEDFLKRLNNNPRLSKLTQELENAKQESKTAREELHGKVMEIQKLNQTIVTNRDQFVHQLNIMTNKEPVLKQRITDLEAELSNKITEIEAKEKSVKTLNDKVNHVKKIAQEEIKNVNEENAILRREYEHLKKNPPHKKEIDEEYRQTRNKWMEDLKSLRNELEMYKTKYKKSSDKLDVTEIKLNENETIHKNTKSSYLNELNTQREGYENVLKEREATIAKLENRVNQLEQLLNDNVTKISSQSEK